MNFIQIVLVCAGISTLPTFIKELFTDDLLINTLLLKEWSKQDGKSLTLIAYSMAFLIASAAFTIALKL